MATARATTKYGTTVKVKGKLFQNLAGEFGKLGEAINQELGDAGVALVRQLLDANLRHPTGYYRSKIVASVMKDSMLISDSRVVYGPWLEGTGSRNKTTRFKGYASFRKATQRLEEAAPHLADQVVVDFVKKMNS